MNSPFNPPNPRDAQSADQNPEAVDPQPVRDWGISWIRTTVPVLWGNVITFVATLSPALAALLANESVYAVVVGAVTLAWYGVFRAVEAHLPAWLTRFLLGANTAPTYKRSALPEVR